MEKSGRIDVVVDDLGRASLVIIHALTLSRVPFHPSENKLDIQQQKKSTSLANIY